jgi:pyruvate/2-oxoglutarate dehydrogenase complex dihydrolipoamide acyltransferase (E2) component
VKSGGLLSPIKLNKELKMPIVKILKEGPYRTITLDGTQPLVGFENLEVGDERSYDAAYAGFLVEANLAEYTDVEVPVIEDTKVFEEDMGEDTLASANAVKLAESLELNLSDVKGTGEGGKVTIMDVRNHQKALEKEKE